MAIPSAPTTCPTRSFAAWCAARIGSSAFSARPLEERRAEVENLRRRSAEAMQAKTAEIMDANAEAIRAALLRHGCSA
jgi:hypothetical protein